MIKILGVLVGLFLATALSLAPASAQPGGALANGPAVSEAPSASSPAAGPANPVSAPTPTPTGGPADTGTGETGEAKQTRVDYAPYVIGGIVGLALIAGVLFYRKRHISSSSKSL